MNWKGTGRQNLTISMSNRYFFEVLLPATSWLSVTIPSIKNAEQKRGLKELDLFCQEVLTAAKYGRRMGHMIKNPQRKY